MEKGIELARRQLKAIIAQVQTFLDMHQVISAGPFLYAFMQEVGGFSYWEITKLLMSVYKFEWCCYLKFPSS